MGQRLNISIRNKDKTLASGYWHWGGYTDSALHYLNAMSDMLIGYCEEKEYCKNFYNLTEIAIGLLEKAGCCVFSHRDDGRIRIGRDQDTSEGNIDIYLDTETIVISGIFWTSPEGDEGEISFKIEDMKKYMDIIYNDRKDKFKIDGVTYCKIV